MNRLSTQTIVYNITDNDITDFVKDLTVLPPKGKENSEQLPSTPSILKRRKSIKSTKSIVESLNKTQIEGTGGENEKTESTFNTTWNETNHFEFSSNTNSKTSNNKLEQSHRITYPEMINILESYKPKHKDLIEKLNSTYEENFSEWKEQMKFGFNILLYGVGSKKSLIEKFVKLHLKCEHHISLLGYHPDLNAKNLIKNIVVNTLNIKENLKTYDEQINAIKENLDFPLFIIVHNIDGVCLRDSETQYRLSELASIENIHFIASVDHINSALLWDHMQLTSFKWIYYDLSTFRSYNEEIMFENSLMINQTGNVQLSSLIHVLKSLTTNAKNIFIIMSEHALNADKTRRSIGFSNLYYECRERFYVSNELTLRAQLTEFIDHKLIKIKTEADGSEMIYLLVDDVNLKLFLDELKDKV